jgi:hypothetical protein
MMEETLAGKENARGGDFAYRNQGNAKNNPRNRWSDTNMGRLANSAGCLFLSIGVRVWR